MMRNPEAIARIRALQAEDTPARAAEKRQEMIDRMRQYVGLSMKPRPASNWRVPNTGRAR